MPHPPARADLACRNCGTQAPLKFCPECGQETTLHPPTLGEFLHEFVGHYVALEGALWRTLRLLLLKPGRLTREYLAGRRKQYVLPLRLYLTASFLFFLALKLMPSAMNGPSTVNIGDRQVGVVAQPQASGVPATMAAASTGSVPTAAHRPQVEVLHPIDCGAAGQAPCNRTQAFVNTVGARFSEHPQEFVEHLRTHLIGIAPYVIFLLLPVFAGIMMLTYRNRHMTYGEHVVFSLHLHAFWFLAFLVIALVPDSLASLLQLAVPVYGTWAMHEAYGGRWGATLVRAVFASALYVVVLAIASMALSLALLAMG